MDAVGFALCVLKIFLSLTLLSTALASDVFASLPPPANAPITSGSKLTEGLQKRSGSSVVGYHLSSDICMYGYVLLSLSIARAPLTFYYRCFIHLLRTRGHSKNALHKWNCMGLLHTGHRMLSCGRL